VPLPATRSAPPSFDRGDNGGRPFDRRAPLIRENFSGRSASQAVRIFQVATERVPCDLGIVSRRDVIWSLGGIGGRTHRTDERSAALLAAMGDVFQVVGCSTVSEPGGLDGRKHHPVTATWTREHEARQTGWWNTLTVHGIFSVPGPLDHL
jgi:hypothetical protein